MKSKYLFSFVTVIIMIFSVCTTLPVKISVPLQADAATDVSNLQPVDSTYSLIKSLEGCDLNCFWDVAQWTIGYGNKCPYTHTSNGTYWHQPGGHSISESEARSLFSSRLSGYVNTLKSNCKGLSMTQNQFDALLSATYNHGNVNSCPLKYYLQGKLTESEAREQYYVWCINAGTKDEKGLRNRRKKEAEVFFGSPKPLNPPTVKTSSKSYTPGTNIEITWNTISNATGYWIDIYRDGEHIISSNIGNVKSYTLKSAVKGEYGIFVTAFKDDGNWESACSECYNFQVKELNAPTVYTKAKYYVPDAEVDIKWNLVDGATGYWIDIWRDGEHILSQSLNNANTSSYTYKCSKGKYGIFVTAYSENGGWTAACSNCYNFYVRDIEAPVPTTNSKYYTPKSNVEINWNKIDDATGYWIDIWKDGEHTYSKNIDNVTSYTISNTEVGTYEVYVAAFNSNGGWSASHNEAIKFYVKESPSKPALDVHTNGSSVILKWNKCTNTDFYGVRINNFEDDSSYVYKEPYEGNEFTIKLPPGKYFANIASVQKNGFYTFSDDIYFEIEDSKIEGDVNNDDKLNVSDAVLLQKWLLGMSNTELANWKAADLCEDGRLDVFDMVEMRKLLIQNK